MSLSDHYRFTQLADVCQESIADHAKHAFYGQRIRLWQLHCMRALDLLIITLAALPLLPLILLIGLLIKLDSPGPVIFRQERVGSRPRWNNGRLTWEIQIFSMYKFRSMFANADQSLHQAYIQNFVKGKLEAVENQPQRFKLASDPRITPIGRILRKTSLDELPQLLNVLKGDMSLVGPRPVPTYEVAEYEECHYARLAARPGLTGLWQLKGRGNVSFEEMIQMDIEYVRTQSPWQNIKILLLTIPAVLSGRGAA
jgi:lipopolysaccharide/colanic/teichoic acid biosynthesis glycosyltransferase